MDAADWQAANEWAIECRKQKQCDVAIWKSLVRHPDGHIVAEIQVFGGFGGPSVYEGKGEDQKRTSFASVAGAVEYAQKLTNDALVSTQSYLKRK